MKDKSPDCGIGLPSDSVDLKQIAVEALVSVAKDKKNPPAARAQSARTLLELMGYVGAGKTNTQDGVSKPLTEMTLDEINAELGGGGD